MSLFPSLEADCLTHVLLPRCFTGGLTLQAGLPAASETNQQNYCPPAPLPPHQRSSPSDSSTFSSCDSFQLESVQRYTGCCCQPAGRHTTAGCTAAVTAGRAAPAGEFRSFVGELGEGFSCTLSTVCCSLATQG